MEITRLIERCRQGDADALGELYRAYAGRIRRVCLRYVATRQEADDVLHDAFVIIFTSFDRLRDASKAEAWMMAITRNVALKYKEHRNALPTVPLEEASIVPSPEDDASNKDIPLDDIMRSLEQLPEGYAKVFRLSVFEGMSHKEIAAELGIAPHSSSSQLTRAKKMLRTIMRQYWAGMLLLLLLIPATFFLLKKNNTTEREKPVTAKQKDEPKSPKSANGYQPSPEVSPITQQPAIAPSPLHQATVITTDTLKTFIAQMPDTIAADTLKNLVAQETVAHDTVVADTTEYRYIPALPDYHIADMHIGKPGGEQSDKQKWSLNLAYIGGVTEQNANHPYGIMGTPMTMPSDDGEQVTPTPVTFKTWSDYAAFLSEQPSDIASATDNILLQIAQSNANPSGNDEIVRTSHHQVPIALSLAMRYKLTDRFSLETGLNYSRLTSDFVTGSNGNTINERQTIHYIGIPVKGIYNIYSKKRWSLYGSLGVTTEVPVYAPHNTSYYLHGIKQATDETTLRAPWQWSVGTGFGMQYNITPNIGLFAEPCLQYYLPTGSSIETYRTGHPFTFSLPVGLRFTW